MGANLIDAPSISPDPLVAYSLPRNGFNCGGDRLTVVCSDLQDNITIEWDSNVIAAVLEDFVPRLGIDTVSCTITAN